MVWRRKNETRTAVMQKSEKRQMTCNVLGNIVLSWASAEWGKPDDRAPDGAWAHDLRCLWK
eukprot:432644-Karenia_brevis.AAC.1